MDSLAEPARGERAPDENPTQREFRWVLEAGMGALLHRAVTSSILRVPAAWHDVLLSAELTAQVRHGGAISATNEVIDVCRELGAPVTLLKGISVSEQCYPAGHLRPMGDIDVLVPVGAKEPVEAALLRRGYIPKRDHGLMENPRHGIPLCHPEFHAWVEVHTALFDDVRRDGVFGPSHVAAQSVASTFHGRPVKRLTDELQLLYIASSWIADMSRYGTKIHPSCLPALFDAVYLLGSRGSPPDSAPLAGWPGSQLAVASLYVMLAFLSRHGVAPHAAPVLPALASGQRIVGAMQLRIIHALLDRYLLAGRPWNLPVPLPVPGRYSIRHQLRKRLLRQPMG